MSVEAPEKVEPGLEVPVPRGAPVALTCLAAFLSAAAAGWMMAGVFRGGSARWVALAGSLIGAGVVAFSFRTRRPGAVQYLALPAGVLFGALLVLPEARGGTANLPGLVAEALRSGGIARPPVAFDPGWRFLLAVMTTGLGAGAAALGTSLGRPRLAVFLPVPLVFAAALVQPEGASVVSSAVSLGLLLASISVAYGVQLAGEGAGSGRFEARRLVRGAVVVTLVVAALIASSRLGLLFPETARDEVIPPRPPETPPPQADRVLFSVVSSRPGPWRMGVLDVYDGRAWLLPPFDTGRLEEVRSEPAARGGSGATFTIADVQGHVVPTVAGAKEISFRGFALTQDPRTEVLRLPEGRARSGLRYTVEAPEPPGGVELASAPAPPPEMEEFLAAPLPPNEVVTLLDEAPTANLWDRLQYVRTLYYQRVVAAGAGNPADLPPARVAAMLAGEEASPYEITAGEALLARWAGIPARIGYGYFGGERDEAERFEVRPRHGATWLETYFEGHGWIAVTGVPPRARASLTRRPSEVNPLIRPSEDLALVVYVPVRLQSIQLLYVTVRYWAAMIAPGAVGLGLLWAALPALARALRKVRRRRWAAGHGPVGRIAVAYAQFRESAADLGIGEHAQTPLGFLHFLEPDDEHAELAWLTTRALWGDLRRDLQMPDAEAAENLARSVSQRLRRAHPLSTRLLAVTSRSSLRNPYTREMPNAWPLRRVSVRGFIGRGFRRIRRLRAVRRILPTALLMLLVLSACAPDRPPSDGLRSSFPERPAPVSVGDIEFQREPGAEEGFERAGSQSLVARGMVFTLRRGGEAHASLQVAEFKAGFGASRREVRVGVLEGLGGGSFEVTRVGGQRVWSSRRPEQRLLLWFSPDGRYFDLLVARADFEDAERVFAAVLAHQRGEEADAALSRVPPPAFDPRRGGYE